MQTALDAAEAGDPKPFEKALQILRRPYAPCPDETRFAATPSESDQAFTTYCGT